MTTLAADSALDRILAMPWYSAVELAPGVFTRGDNHKNVGITRRLFQRCGVRGRRCLDIGAMEGVIATRLARMGGHVVATDAADLTTKINAVKAAYNAEFSYFPSVGSMNLVDRLTDRHIPRLNGRPVGDHCFDLVVCSGVLYHVWSPLHVLAAVRSLMRPGALTVIETAFIHSTSHHMAFNYQPAGHLYDHWSNSWFVSDSLLDHLLRLMHLRPIDCLHMSPGAASGPGDVGRIAVICRAIDEPLADPRESQMHDMTRNFEFYNMLRLGLAGSSTAEPVSYTPGNWSRVMRASTDSCDLYKTVETQPSAVISAEETTLHLDDQD